MSLLMDALKKAELAKRQGGKDKAAEPGANAAPEAAPNDPGAAQSAPPAEPLAPARNTLPELPQSLELLDQEFLEEAAALAQRKSEAAREATEAAPSRAETPVDPAARRGAVRAEAEVQRERTAAQNLFEAKQPQGPNKALAVTIGLFGLMGAVAIGIYVWLQMQPKSGMLGGVAAPTAAPRPRETPSAPLAAPAPSQASNVSAAGPAPETTPIGAPPAPRAEAVKTSAPAAAPAPPGLFRVVRRTPRLDPTLAAAFGALQRGDIESARSGYEAMLRDDPRNADALHGLASVQLRLGHPDRATELYLRAVEADPKDALAQANLISLNSRIDPVRSESRLKLLLAEQPESPFLHFDLGNLYARQNRWAEAQQAYFKAIAAEPDNPDYLFNLAVSLDQLHQTRLAAQYYAKALQAGDGRPAAFDKQQAADRLKKLQP